MRYVVAWLIAITLAVIVWRARAAEPPPPRCEDEILAWCKGYPGPQDMDCEKMAREECAHAPPPRSELCKLRAKRLCAPPRVADIDRESCLVVRLAECAKPPAPAQAPPPSPPPPPTQQ